MPFQSTPSAWRETFHVEICEAEDTDFNPLPPHGGRLGKRCQQRCTMGISIHSLRMEGDTRTFSFSLPRILISIHSLRMEGDSRSIRNT